MRILALIGALGIIVAIVAAVFFFGGYYNIAATEQDNGAVAWALIQVRQASIDRHATDTPPEIAGRSGHDPGWCEGLLGARLRQLPWRSGRAVGQVLRRSQPRAARSEGRRGRAAAARDLLGREKRHTNDRHAELCRRRSSRSGNLVHGRVPEEAADSIGRRLQGLERIEPVTLGRSGPTAHIER